MIKSLMGLALGGLQSAMLARKIKKFAIAGAISIVALTALVATFVLGGWAMFLGFGAILTPAWAAAAATGVLLLITLLLLLMASWVVGRPQPDPIRDMMARMAPLGRQITHDHPAGALLGAAALGAMVGLILRR